MGKRIQITESQLRYIIENKHRLTEQEQPKVQQKTSRKELLAGCKAAGLYKGPDINVENFTTLMKCAKANGYITTGWDYWKTIGDSDKQAIVETIKMGNPKMETFGIASKEWKNVPDNMNNIKGYKGSYSLTSSVWGQTVRSGFYLNDNFEMFIENGKEYGLTNGFVKYDIAIKKINEYNRNVYKQRGTPINFNASVKSPEVKSTYKDSAYRIDPMENAGVFVFYPLSYAKDHIVDWKPGDDVVKDIESFTVPSEGLENDAVEMPDDSYQLLLNDLITKLGDSKNKIGSMRITSSASNLRTTYGGGKSYENNTQLSQDRGDQLYDRLQKDLRLQKLPVPALDGGKAVSSVEGCEAKDSSGRCTYGGREFQELSPTELAKQKKDWVWIKVEYSGKNTEPTEDPVMTKKGMWVYSQWNVKYQKRIG
jgi:hypothetical protein